jgi:hypothetical protein
MNDQALCVVTSVPRSSHHTLGTNRPLSRTTRVPKKTQQNALAAANAWADKLMQRRLVDWPPTWSKTEVIETKSHPDCYTRVTLKDKLLGKANISVLHLYDAVREALNSGLLIVSPPFPILTATAVAKQERVSTRQMPFQSAALILNFTPVDLLS